jgi:menaquinone-dependent protoporphyrinogen oxidase
MAEKRILVGYASLCGSTAEVAEAVAEVLRQSGVAVDVRRAREVRDLSPYSAVVLGTACRMGKVIKEAHDFVRRHQSALAGIPTAYFTVGLKMRETTPEHREETRGYLSPLCDLKQPVATGLFAGAVNYEKLSAPLRFFFSRSGEEQFAEGDWRDWEAIRAWARELAAALMTI